MRHRLLRLQTLAAPGLLILLACGSPTPTPTPTVLLPTFNGSVVLASNMESPHLDVHQDVMESLIALGPGIVYSRLLRLSSGEETALPSLAVECDLCTSWEHPDSLTYVFHIRPMVRWHNIEPLNSQELTAQDVVYSINRLLTPGWPGADLLQAVASVEAKDDLTVILRLNFPDADFLLALANGLSKIVSPKAVAVNGDLRKEPTIGTGPWILNHMEMGQLQFEANPHYYEPELPKLQQLKIVPISNATIRLGALIAGRIDLTAIDTEAWERLQTYQTPVRHGIFSQPGTGVLLGLNTAGFPFQHLDLRQAFFHAIDPWQALDDVWHGHGEVALGLPVASRSWHISLQEFRSYLANPSQAKTLLKGVGVESPVVFTLDVADFGDNYLALGDEYQEMLQAAGFQVELRRLNPRTYAEEVWDQGDFQAFLGPLPPIHTPNAFLYGLLHSQGRWHLTGYANEELDRLIEDQAIAKEGRGDLIREIQNHLLGNAVLFMPVTGTSIWVWQDRVEGFTPNFAASEYFHWARIMVTD